MADSNNMDMNIDIQANGVEQSTALFNNLSISIQKVTTQVGKLSSKLTGLMRNFTRLNNTTNKKTSILSSSTNNGKTIKSIIKKSNNRLNIGDMSDLTSGKLGSLGIYRLLPSFDKQLNETRKSFKSFNNELKNTGTQSKNASQKLWQLSKNIATISTLYYTASRLARVVSNVVKESGTWIENLNLFAVTFGESNYREMLDWAVEYAGKLGMANNEIVRMTGYFKQLSSAIGITGEQGSQLSQILTQLGYDFASFYNIDTASAFEKLQSGIFSGQIRTLRSIGIDVSQAAVQNLLDTSEALQAMGASANQLTQTQKVLARMILTMQAGTNAFGDMARSIDTLQNRQRVLSASLENLRLAIGDALAEPAREFFAYGIAIVQVVTDIVRALVPLQKELSYDIGDTVFTEITDEAESAESSINQLSFDKFNALTSGNEEQLSITEALNQMLEEQIGLYEQVSSQFDGIDERVKEIRDTILQWLFPDKTLEDIENIFNSNETLQFSDLINEINPTIKSILSTLQTLWGIAKQFFGLIKNISPELGKAISFILQMVSGLIKLLDSMNLLYPLILSLITLNIFNKLKMLTGLSFSGILGGMSKLTAFFANANASMQLFGSETKNMLNEGVRSFKQYFTKINSDGTKTFNSLRAGATALNSVMTGIMAYSIADSFFGQFQKEGAVIVGTLGLVASALSAVVVSAMAMAGALSWGVAIPAIVASIAVGVASVKSMIRGAKEMQGYATGGIPDKSELFYMNEHGIPEALVNTGGTNTNVINQQQLKQLVRDGYIEAMAVSGSQDVVLRIEGNDINNSAFARAIFPAMKAESKRRGGNQL